MEGRYTYVKSDHEYTFDNGAQWLIRHLDSEGKVRGTDLDHVYVDEAVVSRESESIDEATYSQLTARISRNPAGTITLVTNPGPKSSWVYRRWFTDENEDHAVFRMRTLDNPFLPQSYIADLMRMPESWRKQFVDGEWGVLEGAAFPIEEGVHIRPDPPTGSPRYFLSFDWGYNDAFACLLFSVTDGHVHIHREWVKSKMLKEHHLPHVKELMQGVEITGFTADTADSETKSGARLVSWFSYMLGLPFYRPRKNRWEGWQQLLYMLHDQPAGRPLLTIDPSCVLTIDSGRSLVWDDKGEDIAPGNDHAWDATRYACMCGLVNKFLPNLIPRVQRIDW